MRWACCSWNSYRLSFLCQNPEEQHQAAQDKRDGGEDIEGLAITGFFDNDPADQQRGQTANARDAVKQAWYPSPVFMFWVLRDAVIAFIAENRPAKTPGNTGQEKNKPTDWQAIGQGRQNCQQQAGRNNNAAA